MSEHIQTDKCGFDRNGSHSAGTYVCTCGWRDATSEATGLPEEPKYYDNDGYICERGVMPKFVRKQDYDALRAAYEKAISEGRERRWPDDFETGMQHAYEVAACQPDLHTALRAIADEIKADACHPHEHECPTCGMVRPSLSAAEERERAARELLKEVRPFLKAADFRHFAPNRDAIVERIDALRAGERT